MRLFEEEMQKKKEIDSLNLNQLRVKFDELSDERKINILIRWFGTMPLTDKVFKNEKGIEYVKEELLK